MDSKKATLELGTKPVGGLLMQYALPAIVAFVGLLGVIVIYYMAGSSHVSVANYMAFNAAYGQVTAAIMALAAIAGQVAQIGPLLEMVKPIL